jgi:NHS family nucleoside permease-like MFS transporter
MQTYDMKNHGESENFIYICKNHTKMGLKIKLAITCFLQYAVMGAYTTSLGRYLVNIGMGDKIGLFFAMIGIVSILMPAIIGTIGDRWIQAQRLLGICHLIAAAMMLATAYYGYKNGSGSSFGVLFILFSFSIAFYMPTISLCNSVTLDILSNAGIDTVKFFAIIRMFGTIGFIFAMWSVDLLGFQTSHLQFVTSSIFGIALALFTLTLPHCHTRETKERHSLLQALRQSAFSLFRQKQFAIFLIFSMLLNICLQITNSFANPFFNSFGTIKQFADTFGVNHANILMSFGQMSETLCMLLVPFLLRHLDIKKVMLMAMVAWTIHFGMFAFGNPGERMWMLVFAMILYGMAFDFYSIAGTLFVDEVTGNGMRASGQGVYMIMTGGFGTMIGTLWAQMVVNSYTAPVNVAQTSYTAGNWQAVWSVFAVYALITGIVFAIIFKPKKIR